MNRRLLIFTTLVGLALALPWILSGTRYATYVEHVVVQMMLLGLYAMGWDFLHGYVGLFSFGHAAFFGIGSYVTAILIVQTGFTFAPGLVVAAAVAAMLAGLVVGFLSSRVGAAAVFLVTFAAAEALYLLVLSDPGGLTAGDNGIPGVTPGSVLGVNLSNQVVFYYVALGAVLGSYAILVTITRSRFGLVLLGIRDNEVRVRFAGFNVEQYKTAAFGISACFSGLAGSLTAMHERVASPEALSWVLSGDAVLYTTLGGTGTLVGPILGASLVILARETLSDFFRSWLIFVGLVYIVLVFFLPSGLYPLLLRGGARRPAAQAEQRRETSSENVPSGPIRRSP
jgi:branched-chain amino acid transport system permease protein